MRIVIILAWEDISPRTKVRWGEATIHGRRLLDARLLLFARLQLTGSFYRGLALGGLGGGAYKDFAYSPNPITGRLLLPARSTTWADGRS